MVVFKNGKAVTSVSLLVAFVGQFLRELVDGDTFKQVALTRGRLGELWAKDSRSAILPSLGVVDVGFELLVRSPRTTVFSIS